MNTYPIELQPPDIQPYRAGNCGIDYVSTFDSGKAGPHLMLAALTHGNELCGAIALDWLLRQGVRPLAGKLTLAFINVAAYARFTRDDPRASRFVDEDFNRVWNIEALESGRNSVELRRARELRALVGSVDALLDIHSMQHATPPLMLCGMTEKARRLARQLGTPAHLVCDAGHAAGRRMRDYADFADEASTKIALLIECGQHWALASGIVAIDAMLRFLLHFGAIGSEFAAPHLAPPPAVQRVVEVTQAVTVASDAFQFTAPYVGMELIARAGTVIGHDGGRPVTTPYDDCVLIMPSMRLRKGETAVRLGRIVS
ncbi:MAG: succinylglutamate desuccinylase [Betaproteobacteria bacterium]|nr:MAG: succinylglutamate desuccinylase [Betaproteobacteria bacterium]